MNLDLFDALYLVLILFAAAVVTAAGYLLTLAGRALARRWHAHRAIAHFQRDIDLHLDTAYARLAEEIRKEQQ